MRELVSVQDTGLRESLVTLGADKLFLSGMGELVSLQVTGLRESLFTLCAFSAD